MSIARVFSLNCKEINKSLINQRIEINRLFYKNFQLKFIPSQLHSHSAGFPISSCIYLLFVYLDMQQISNRPFLRLMALNFMILHVMNTSKRR